MPTGCKPWVRALGIRTEQSRWQDLVMTFMGSSRIQIKIIVYDCVGTKMNTLITYMTFFFNL